MHEEGCALLESVARSTANIQGCFGKVLSSWQTSVEIGRQLESALKAKVRIVQMIIQFALYPENHFLDHLAPESSHHSGFCIGHVGVGELPYEMNRIGCIPFHLDKIRIVLRVGNGEGSVITEELALEGIELGDP
jgi:hypothetical protein